MRSTTTYFAKNGNVYARTPNGIVKVTTAMRANGRDLARFEKVLNIAQTQTPRRFLSW